MDSGKGAYLGSRVSKNTLCSFAAVQYIQYAEVFEEKIKNPEEDPLGDRDRWVFNTELTYDDLIFDFSVVGFLQLTEIHINIQRVEMTYIKEA